MPSFIHLKISRSTAVRVRVIDLQLLQFYRYLIVPLNDAMYISCSLCLVAIDYYPIAFEDNNNSRTS